MGQFRYSVSLAVAVAGTLAAAPGMAQTKPADARESLEEVVVTASKRQERIIDVPYAVTAIGGSEVAERGAFDIKELQYSVPGLAMNDSNTAGADRIQLRGVDAGSGTGLPTVGVYVDDVGISIDQQQRDSAFPLVDIERIEVLRGPQGTLYGQGSVSGTIRYLTRDPSLNKVDGFVEGGMTSQQDGGTGYRVSGAAGGPIVDDKLGVRVVAGYDQRPGWIDYPNAKVSDANQVDMTFVRGKMLWKPSDSVRASLLYQYADQKADANNNSGAGTNQSSTDFNLSPSDDKSHLVNLILDFDTRLGTLTSSTGYVNRDFYFVAAGSAINFPPGWLLAFDTKFTQWTEELRLASKSEGPFRYVVGAWYRDFKSDSVRTITGAPPFLAFLNRTGTDPVNSKAYALFADGTWAFSDETEASIGLRYYSDDRETINYSAAGLRTSAKASFSSTSPRFNLLHKWNEGTSTYATAAKGFRSGGFNSDDSTFDAEDLWSYELGTKAALMGGRLYLDGAVYYLDYKNRQSQNVVGLFAVTTNGGKASGPGIELAMTSRLDHGLELDLSLSYNDVKYDQTTFENDEGERFNYVPPFTGSASLSQRFPLGSGGLRGTWRVDYQYADGFYLVARTQNAQGQRVIFAKANTKSQNLLNIRVGVETDTWGVTAGVQNLLDEDAVIFPSVFVPDGGVRVRPRTYGVNFRYSW